MNNVESEFIKAKYGPGDVLAVISVDTIENKLKEDEWELVETCSMLLQGVKVYRRNIDVLAKDIRNRFLGSACLSLMVPEIHFSDEADELLLNIMRVFEVYYSAKDGKEAVLSWFSSNGHTFYNDLAGPQETLRKPRRSRYAPNLSKGGSL